MVANENTSYLENDSKRQKIIKKDDGSFGALGI